MTESRSKVRSELPGELVPIVGWLPRYEGKWLSKDLVAAASVWALIVPQAVAYASIAGVPPQYGLYAALFGLAAYAVFGSSRHLVTGPSATVAAVSASAVGVIGVSGAPESDTWITMTAALAVVAGLVYLALGLLRLGWITWTAHNKSSSTHPNRIYRTRHCKTTTYFHPLWGTTPEAKTR
jgi:MFS superfamily sulfate permease-like transporter